MIRRAALFAVILFAATAICAEPEIQSVTDAAKAYVTKQEVAGVVTLVTNREKILHLSAVGDADIESKKPMAIDTMFWIASMTKPITGAAIMMLQDEGKLNVDDPVEKYIPELAEMKTADGKVHKLTLKHLLTHSSGLSEAPNDQAANAKTLSEVIPLFAKKPLQFEPGSKWQYCQSGINSLGRIIEVASGQPLQDFFQKRLFDPLGMKDTTFFPNADQQKRIVTAYKFADGKLTPVSSMALFDPKRPNRYPAANGGLYSTAPDYARFAQMLLNNGSLDGKQYLKPESVKFYSSVLSGDLKTGFTEGNGWGMAVCVVRQPQGVSAMLSPGSYGHGGAWGTQAWIDPVKGLAYILMVQRANFPNSDASDLRKDFQAAAAAALAK
jgi:CubicO group peptidase (beta-lactamase class C family)